MTTPSMTFEEWSLLVKHHDLTYAYSDDPSVYRRGQAVYDLITREATAFPRADTCRVWNAMVHKFLIPEARAPFYWRDKTIPQPSPSAPADLQKEGTDEVAGIEEKGNGTPL